MILWTKYQSPRKKIETMASILAQRLLKNFASIYGCKQGERSNMYLGLPLKGNHKSFVPFGSCYTSKGGRLTLVQAILSNLLTYYMSLFEMPQKVAADIERLFKNYLWKDDPRSIRWNIINLPKEKGGFSLFLIKKNKALLAKWMEIIMKKRPCGDIIKAKYTPNQTKINPIEGLEVHQQTSKPHH